MSDLFIQQTYGSSVDASNGSATSASPNEPEIAWLPAPSRSIDRRSPSRIRFELYNLGANDAGNARYEIEERVETHYEKPTVGRQLASVGKLVGQMVFPVYALAAGTAALLTQKPELDGSVTTRVVELEAGGTIVTELALDLSTLRPGVYTIHVTVLDLVTNELRTRFVSIEIG